MFPWNFEPEGAPKGAAAWRWLADWVAMPALLATPARPLAEMDEPASHLSGAMVGKFSALLGPRNLKQDLAERARHAAMGTVDRLRQRVGDLSRLPDAVVYPRNGEDVLALLKLCAEMNVAATPFGTGSGLGAMPVRGAHAAIVTFDLSAMSHLVSVDALSGLARAEAGITEKELSRQLAAQGAALKGAMAGSLGGHIARNTRVPWLHGVRLAAPEGALASGPWLVPGSQGTLGVITSASIQIRALEPAIEYRRYLFSDFPSALTALREATRHGLVQDNAWLWDAGETHFRHQLDLIGREPRLTDRLADIHRRLRQFDQQACALTIGFGGTEPLRKCFNAMAKRLGALPLGRVTPEKTDHRERLMDRGLGVETLETTANWAKLPRVYAAMRASLDRAMRAGAPRQDAHGLVLGEVSDAGHDGAKLRLTMIFPRMLGNDVAQAENLRQEALKALSELSGPREPLEEKLKLGIKQMLDPKAILNPGIRLL